MKVTLIGLGGGTKETLTDEALQAIRETEILIGAKRLLESVPSEGKLLEAAICSDDIIKCIEEKSAENVCVLFSGDTGFYSGAKKLTEALDSMNVEISVLPGISSVQLFASRLKRPWQDWKLCSAHGTDCDAVSEIMDGRETFFLTGGKLTPQKICSEFSEAGLGKLRVFVGERLSYPDEKITEGTAAELSRLEFEPLSVLLTEKAPVYERRVHGIPDEDFIRDKVPMTKQEVRSVIVSKLAIRPGDVCWDVGAGTGSVSVEMAHESKKVYAVEEKPEACGLIEKNRKKFLAWSLNIIEGKAPEALRALPKPDCVFIGGSGGTLEEIFKIIGEKNPSARVCVSAIALETLEKAMSCMEAFGYDYEVIQIASSAAKKAGSLHLLMAHNPIFIITGKKE